MWRGHLAYVAITLTLLLVRSSDAFMPPCGRRYVLGAAFGRKDQKKPKATGPAQPTTPIGTLSQQKKLKAAGPSQPNTPAMTPSSQQPKRVGKTPGSISVRQQIAWAKAYKRFMSNANAPAGQAKKFKKERGPKEEEEEEVEIDYINTPPPAVFVDGYNVIGYINSVEGRAIDLDSARDCLISDLCVLRGATGWWIELVFDAYNANAPERTDSVDNVFVTFTGRAETADGYIERRFNELQREGFKNMVVATDDSLLRMSATGWGAGYLSCGMLLEELRIAYRGWDAVGEEMTQKARRARPKLGDGVGAEVLGAMKAMRDARAKGQGGVEGGEVSEGAVGGDWGDAELEDWGEEEWGDEEGGGEEWGEGWAGQGIAVPASLIAPTALISTPSATAAPRPAKKRDKYVDLKDVDWSKMTALATDTTASPQSKPALTLTKPAPKFPSPPPRPPGQPAVKKEKQKFVSIGDIKDVDWSKAATAASFDELFNNGHR